jgi:transcription antitermination factor NusA-like protein
MTNKQADYIGAFIGKESKNVQDVINALRRTDRLEKVPVHEASEIIGAWKDATISSQDRVLESIERKLLAYWRI